MMYHQKFVASVKSNGKILKEVDGGVILPFKSEYSVLLKNLESRKAIVTISIDGQDVLYGKSLIIDSNSSMELERFVDNINQGNKFKFIKKTQEISDHRGDKVDDGLIRVEYRFEKQKSQIFVYPYYTYSIGTVTSYNAPTLATNCSSFLGNNVTITSSNCKGRATNSTLLNSKVEDGITVQGSKSEQKFRPGYTGELEENSHVIVLALRGSDKINEPITVRTKFQCPTCGRTSKDKFCGNCGTSLIKY